MRPNELKKNVQTSILQHSYNEIYKNSGARDMLSFHCKRQPKAKTFEVTRPDPRPHLTSMGMR